MLRTFRGCGAILLNKPKKLVEIVGAMTKALNSRQVTVKIRTGWDGESCTVLCHFVLHCIVLYCIVLYYIVSSCLALIFIILCHEMEMGILEDGGV